MSPAAHAWLLIGVSAFFVVAVYALVRDARKRAALRPPVTIRRSRSEPLYGWDFAGARYVVERTRILDSVTHVWQNASFETIAIDSPASPVRFLVDQATVYRGVSDLFAAARVDSSRIAPDLTPFWRSDEPQRLQSLIDDERFGRILLELRTVPDFAALVVVDANDARIPVGSPMRKVPRRGDAIALTRSGEEVPFRDERDVEEDVARMTRLRDLLTSIQFPETLAHAAAPGLARTALTRTLRILILFALIIAGIWIVGILLWRL
jgi:hypothetical protein